MNAWFDLKEARSGDEKQIHQKRNDIRKQNNGALADSCYLFNPKPKLVPFNLSWRKENLEFFCFQTTLFRKLSPPKNMCKVGHTATVSVKSVIHCIIHSKLTNCCPHCILMSLWHFLCTSSLHSRHL